MARDYANLSHHESLRLDYLQKNIHYLNQREREELFYLQDKLAGRFKMPSNPSPPKQTSSVSSDRTPEGLPRFAGKENSVRAGVSSKSPDAFAQAGQVSQSQLNRTPEGLPQYEQPSRRSRGNKGARLKKAGPVNQGLAPKKSKAKFKLPSKKTVKRVFLGLLAVLIAVIGVMIFRLFKGYNAAKSDPATAEAAKVEVFNGEKTKDGINILVLGTDVRAGQASGESRTDSIMVVNIGNSDKKVKIVSFMRDTLINIPGYSYEDGYETYYDQKLNAAFSYGEQDNRQGAEAVRVALKKHFDLDIQYYAMVDFKTFAAAVDTIFPKGVKMDAKFSTVDGVAVDSVEVPDDLKMKDGLVPNQTIKVGEQYMDGRTLLNYARFRKDDEGDNGRVRRQQEVMAAILQQVKNPVKLFSGSEALGKVMGMTSTNVPYSFILSKGVGVLSDASNDIEQMTVPAMGDWIDEYDAYGGQALLIDFNKYQEKLAEEGFR